MYVYRYSLWLLNLEPFYLVRHSVTAMAENVESQGEDGKPKVDLTDLAREWEQQLEVRNHLRKDGSTVLFHEKVGETVKDCCVPHIHAILKVLLLRTASVEGHPQASIHLLREEIDSLYKKCGRTPKEADVVRDSWMIRSLCKFTKMKTRIGKVSTVPHLICFQFCVLQMVMSNYNPYNPYTPLS